MVPTIYDIAKLCNCSTTTVSKVLNRSGKISEKKKEEILRVAKELGYVANKTASSLASSNKSSKMVGIILHVSENKSITHEMFSKILNAFRIEMEKHDYDICFLRNINNDDSVSYESLVNARGLDGVFILSADVNNTKVQNLVNSDIPLVAFDILTAKYVISSNNKEIVAKMVDYLVSLGHKNISFVYPHKYGVSKERYDGFRLGLERNHIEFKEEMVVDAPYYCKDSAKIAIDKSLKDNPNATVIMLPDDYTAVNAISYLRKLNKKVPLNISLTGFDGIELANAVRPSLVTVRQDVERLGLEAAKLLLKQICHEEIEHPHSIVEATILRGKSVAKIN